MATKLLAYAIAAFLLSATAADAQDWPQRPIVMVVSQSAGASPDIMARLLAHTLSEPLGQGVVVENKPGGGNVIGANAVSRAAPDGYTFFFATSAALVGNPFLMKNLSYDSVKDFEPVALVTRSHQVMVVHPSVSARTLGELIALDKAAPGKLSIAVDGPRNLAGVTARAFNKRADTQFVLVPYPNINQGVQDTMAGRIEVGVFSISVVESLIRDGALRAIAIAANKKSAALPDVPLISETLAGFDLSGWFMLMAPAGTPKPIVDRLSAAIATAIRDPKIAEMGRKLGFDLESPGDINPQRAAAYLQEQLALWKELTTELGIEAQ
jgi:tripartite-type tricarboxylate transporter receptor subunit TctC